MLARTAALAVALGTVASVSSAQGTCAFTVDENLSSFNWSSTVNFGAIGGGVQNDSGVLGASGSANIDLATTGNPASTGQFAGGNLSALGTLSGSVTGPFGIVLGTWEVSGVQISVTSSVFQGAPDGTFSADFQIEILAGTITAPVVGTTVLTSPPADAGTYTGTVTTVGSNYQVSIPLVLTVPIDASGITGTADISGQVVATAPIASGCNTTLFGEPDTLSLLTGGTFDMTLDAGPPFAGDLYIVLGSLAGTAPGLPVDSVVLPLAFDTFTSFTLTAANSPNLPNTLNFLGGTGQSTAGFVLPLGTNPALAGFSFYFAYLGFDFGGTGAATIASNPVSVLMEI